jgi:transposase
MEIDNKVVVEEGFCQRLHEKLMARRNLQFLSSGRKRMHELIRLLVNNLQHQIKRFFSCSFEQGSVGDFIRSELVDLRLDDRRYDPER